MLKFHTTLRVLIVGGMLALAGPVLAEGFKECTKESKAQWQPQTEAEAAAKATGYEVRKSKIEGSCYEVYAVDKSGGRFELFYNPVDMTLVKTIKKS